MDNNLKELKEMKDSLGRYRTLSLFRELCLSDHESLKPIYTLQEKDIDGLPSAYKIYMGFSTEYQSGVALVGSWQHWQRLLKCKPFMESLVKWREEKESELEALGVQCMIASARAGNATACKWLTSRGWKGKPTKEDSKEKNNSDIFKYVEDELDRISEHTK